MMRAETAMPLPVSEPLRSLGMFTASVELSSCCCSSAASFWRGKGEGRRPAGAAACVRKDGRRVCVCARASRVCIFEHACTRNEGRWSNLENDGTSDTHCELYHKHEQEGDNVAADGSLAALADAVDADYAGQ